MHVLEILLKQYPKIYVTLTSLPQDISLNIWINYLLFFVDSSLQNFLLCHSSMEKTWSFCFYPYLAWSTNHQGGHYVFSAYIINVEKFFSYTLSFYQIYGDFEWIWNENNYLVDNRILIIFRIKCSIVELVLLVLVCKQMFNKCRLTGFIFSLVGWWLPFK